MAISHFFTRDIIIRRMQDVSGRRRAYQSIGTVEGMIQELSKEAAQRLGIIEERTFEAWFDLEEDVREGDRVFDRYNTEYMVKTVTKKDYGVNQHLQVILEKANE